MYYQNNWSAVNYGHSTGGFLQRNLLLLPASSTLGAKSKGSVPFKNEDQGNFPPEREDWPHREQQINTITMIAKECQLPTGTKNRELGAEAPERGQLLIALPDGLGTAAFICPIFVCFLCLLTISHEQGPQPVQVGRRMLCTCIHIC